jgi:hypothetical protein
MRNTLFVAALFALTTAACATASVATEDATFENVVAQVIEPSCTFSSCHAAPTMAAKLDLSPESICDALVNQPSCLFPDRMRVVPGNPDDSFFFHKLTGQGLNETPTGNCGTSTNLEMPFGASALSDADLALVHNWIAAGAQCTGKGTGPTTVAPVISIFSANNTAPLAGETISVTLTLDRAAAKDGQMIMLDMDQSVLSAPRQMMVPAGQSSIKFDAYAQRPTSRFTVRAHAGQSTKDLVLRIGGLEIAEVLANPMGTDDQAQWIKLHNKTSLPIDLNNYRFKAGQGSYTVNAGLSGTIPAGGCVVIGGPIQSGGNAEPVYSQAFDFVPNLPYGGTQAAAFAVFDNNTAPVNGVATPVDTMLVGSSNAAGLLGADAQIATPGCATPAEGMSAQRTGASTCAAAQMQPNTCN